MFRILGFYTLKYSQSKFFDRGTISNFDTLFYTSQRLKLLHRIGPNGPKPTRKHTQGLFGEFLVISKIYFWAFFIESQLQWIFDMSFYQRLSVMVGNADWQIELLTIQIWIPTNWDDDYDMNPIPTTNSSRQSRFQSNFDLFFIKVDHFLSLFD